VVVVFLRRRVFVFLVVASFLAVADVVEFPVVRAEGRESVLSAAPDLVRISDDVLLKGIFANKD